MTVCDQPATRASDGDREVAIAELHDAFVHGRLSHATLVDRIDGVFAARTHRELALLLVDLGEAREGPRGHWLFSLVRHVSRLLHGIPTAWRAPLLPPLALPAGVEDRLIGRATDCDLLVRHASVSRAHAALHRGREGWYVVDLGSTNGTFVNGWRVSAPVRISEGDVLTVGASSFQIVSPAGAMAAG